MYPNAQVCSSHHPRRIPANKAQVEATDLSPIQPQLVTPNLRFIIDDCTEEDWCHPPSSVDYIHTRVLLGCLQDFRSIIRKARKYLRPGAWYESQEIYPKPFCDDGTMPKDWPFLDWYNRGDEAMMLNDTPLRIGNKIKGWCEKEGLVDVHELVFKLPLSGWPLDGALKDIGTVCLSAPRL